MKGPKKSSLYELDILLKAHGPREVTMASKTLGVTSIMVKRVQFDKKGDPVALIDVNNVAYQWKDFT